MIDFLPRGGGTAGLLGAGIGEREHWPRTPGTNATPRATYARGTRSPAGARIIRTSGLLGRATSPPGRTILPTNQPRWPHVARSSAALMSCLYRLSCRLSGSSAPRPELRPRPCRHRLRPSRDLRLWPRNQGSGRLPKGESSRSAPLWCDDAGASAASQTFVLFPSGQWAWAPGLTFQKAAWATISSRDMSGEPISWIETVWARDPRWRRMRLT